MRLVGDASTEWHAKPHQITLCVVEGRGVDDQDVDLLGRVKASL